MNTIYVPVSLANTLAQWVECVRAGEYGERYFSVVESDVVYCYAPGVAFMELINNFESFWDKKFQKTLFIDTRDFTKPIVVEVSEKAPLQMVFFPDRAVGIFHRTKEAT